MIEAYLQIDHFLQRMIPACEEVEKAQWDKVEIDTVNPAEIAGLKKYVSVKELGLSPYLYLKTLNYSEKDKPLVYANEYFNTEIIKFNLIRQKNIQY